MNSNQYQQNLSKCIPALVYIYIYIYIYIFVHDTTHIRIITMIIIIIIHEKIIHIIIGIGLKISMDP